MRTRRPALAYLLVFCTALPFAVSSAPAQVCAETPGGAWSSALHCYVDALRQEPLRYAHIDTHMVGSTRVSRFELHSQQWSPAQASHPSAWRHEVRMFIPAKATHRTAILVVSGGTRHPSPDDKRHPPRNESDADMLALAERTRGIVVEIGDVPNQYLRWADGVYRKEDTAVAHSWKLALEGGETAPFASLHLPMAAAVVRAMDLAERELKPWDIRHFIVTGASKRGWATWLASLADSRVKAIATIAADVLDTQALIERTRQTYGGHWPVAFHDYWAAGVLRERHTPAFANLMRLEDPLAYLDTHRNRQRLRIPKYLINASGDDFFIPDHTGHYLSRLPAPTLVRALPNSDHGGAAAAFPDAVVPFVKRIMAGRRLPRMTHRVEWRNAAPVIRLTLDEQPAALTQWTASNGKDRDFRLACDVRYVATALEPTRRLDLPLPVASRGWTATFVEARLADGLIVTTPVEVWPDASYPVSPPATSKPACATLPESPPTPAS